MKTKTWILLLAGMLLVCAGFSLWLLMPAGTATRAEIWSEGVLVDTVDLRIDQTLTVQSGNGINVITVRDGKIGVTQADCPDGYCVDRGMCGGGAQIVCLPNRLVIQFVDEPTVDGVVG